MQNFASTLKIAIKTNTHIKFATARADAKKTEKPTCQSHGRNAIMTNKKFIILQFTFDNLQQIPMESANRCSL